MKKRIKQEYTHFINELDTYTLKKYSRVHEDTIEGILSKINKEWTMLHIRRVNSITENTDTEGYTETYTHTNNNIPTLKNINMKSENKGISSIWVKKRQADKIKVDNSQVVIKNLGDLICFIETYPADVTKEYIVSMERFYNIHSSLIDLNNMIGMQEVKENIVDQVLYFIQDLHKHNIDTNTNTNTDTNTNTNTNTNTDTNTDKKNDATIDFMHTVIYGPPGTGKTEVAKLIGQIFCKLGILKKGTFRKVTRSDLIAGFLGQSAIKTRDVIQDCLGGVLFIDEAYSLGCSDKKDSFSKECIDTLCEALSNYKEELMVIIAGYETELKQCFFQQNQGLESRFTWRFKTDHYKAEELYQIFLKKVNDCGWQIDSINSLQISSEWFEKNKDYFTFFGRDMETLLAKIKIVHGRRVFCKPAEDKRRITFEDLEKGFEYYLKNDEVKNRKEDSKSYLYSSMYC